MGTEYGERRMGNREWGMGMGDGNGREMRTGNGNENIVLVGKVSQNNILNKCMANLSKRPFT